MDLEFFEDALAEVDEDRAWYRNRSKSAEAGFLRELDHAIQQVTDAPTGTDLPAVRRTLRTAQCPWR
jgi:hypothetical protein